jgi:hypothetical protein
LVIDLNKSRLEVMDRLLPPTLDTYSSEMEHSFSPLDGFIPNVVTLDFQAGIPLGIAVGTNK